MICLQFLVIALHDWLDIPGWTHGRQVRAAVGFKKLLIASLVNCLFPGFAAGFAIYYWHRAKPEFVLDYWIVYFAITMASAIAQWWVPYFFGATEKMKQFYSKTYDGTWQILPPRGENPRPNVMRLYFHGLFLINLVLATILWLRVA